MSISVTDVSFSVAKTVATGSCGFCRVIINDVVAINRIRVSRYDGGFDVLLPRSEKPTDNSKEPKPIVQLLDEDTVEIIRSAVLSRYHELIKTHNGFYQQKSNFSKKQLVN